ncbi:MAG: hypothetical protein IH944_12675 [Armatimonadetes bacterium]|nr:hypothetical protein [Armatimonadota bacterium]
MSRSITGGLVALGLVLLVALAIYGTGGTRDRWLGEWTGELDIVSPEAPPDGFARTLNTLIVKIKLDGTFDITASGMGSNGKWRFAGDELRLKTTHVMGKSIADGGPNAVKANKEIVLTWNGDGTITFIDPGSDDPSPVVLSPAPQRNAAQ